MTLYVCKCGYPIWEDVLEYSDDWENSPTWGQPITHCPQCGESLIGGHRWWTARADTPDGYLELWETTIQIRRADESLASKQRPNSDS